MKIAGTAIPESEIEKLSKTKQRIIYRFYDADGMAITTHTFYQAGGSGFSQRKRELNTKFLDKYGLEIKQEKVGNSPDGRSIHAYWMQRREDLPIRPNELIGEV